MENETVKKCAYHESGRILFAYLSGYSCNSMQLSDVDSGHGVSILNGGVESDIIKALLEGNSAELQANKQKAVEIAIKLLVIYCAGATTQAYYANEQRISSQLEITFSHQDLLCIEKLQKFLLENNPKHPEDYPNQVIGRVLKTIDQNEMKTVIKSLVEAALAKYDARGKMLRYDIEEALIAGGMKISKVRQGSGFELNLAESPNDSVAVSIADKGIPTEVASSKQPELSNLDYTLQNFLSGLNPKLDHEAIYKATQQLKNLFREHIARSL